MSYKRPRKDFEADLQKQESPYVSYGTPLPPLDDNVRDDGSFVPVWQQEVRDERGRKRLHGAFTGGWSAGYFNTVGSKEGWTPSTFVSSRANRAKDQKRAQQRPEDYMDDEDLAEAEESANLQASGSFSGLGSTEEDGNRRAGLLDIFRPTGATIGVKLLQKMGWRQGQGIGPRIRRAAREEENDNTASEKGETHLFAPDNAEMIAFRKKNDHKGLGFEGETSLPRRDRNEAQAPGNENDDEEEENAFSGKPRSKPSAKAQIKGSFGVGVLNDTGSDEDDPYSIGPNIKYNRVIGGDKKNSKKGTSIKTAVGNANPLLSKRPVFTSKKSKAEASGFRRCHDGRLPLDGFVLAVRSAPPQKSYPPPKIPEGWQSKFSVEQAVEETAATTGFQSTAEAAKAPTLDPKSRATLLGEEQLPGKSVFDFLSKETRERLAASSGRTNLPAAGNEPAPAEYRRTEAEKARAVRDMLPDLDQESAAQALIHRSMPYADDKSKRQRYRSFLSLKAGHSTALSPRATDDAGKEVSTDEYIKEMREFAHAAQVFRPMSGLMATRFTSSSSSVLAPNESDPAKLLSKPAERPRDPAEEAAALGMYGPMTRLVADFYPTRLVCKRFNVKPPAHVQVDPGGPDGSRSATMTAEPVSKGDLHRMMQDAASSRFGSTGGRGFVSAGTEGGSEEKSAAEREGPATEIDMLPRPSVVDVERNEALEQPRPGEELFKAIFGSDDEDE